MTDLFVPAEQKQILQQISENADNELYSRWAKVILLYHDGEPTRLVADKVGLSRSRTRYIKQIFTKNGLSIFGDFESVQKNEEAPVEQTPILLGPGPTDQGPSQEKTKKPASLRSLANSGDIKSEEFVAQVAGVLFDTTQPLHGLLPRDKEILNAAALLHAIKTRPKDSQAAILAQPIGGVSNVEQNLIANLVRHQRSTKKTTSLSEETQEGISKEKFLLMLGLLKLAVSLNSSKSQSSELKIVSSNVNELHLQIRGPHAITDVTAAQSAASTWANQTGQIVVISSDSGLNIENVRATTSTLSSPGLHPDDPMAEAGRKVLRYHFLQMLLHEPGTRLGEDIEELHDMRVATRRMRAAFEVFGENFDSKSTKSIRKGMRNTGRALGAVRDLDVFMEKATHYITEQTTEANKHLEPLLDTWIDQRENARDTMLTYLDSENYFEFVYQMNEFVNTPGMGTIPVDTAIPVPNRVREVAPILIYTRLAAVRAYDQVLGNASIEQLHALRITFKYLRYTIEFFQEVLGAEVKGVIEKIKLVQDHLGDLNDADVASNLLQEFLESWDSRQVGLPLEARQNPQPVVQYLAYRANERFQLMVSFPEIWREFNQPEFLRQIALAVSVL